MKTIALIPARGGSKRLPGKNLMNLGELPLLAHSILYAKQFPEIIDAVFVSTDDAAIADCSKQHGAGVIMRPKALSGDLEPTVTAVVHALSVLGDGVSTVILLQPTNPLRPAGLLEQCWAEYTQKNRGVFTVSLSDKKLGRISNGAFEPYNYTPGQRSQDLEPLYFENGLLYISPAETIRAGAVIGPDFTPVIVSHPFAEIDIDTAADFDRAEYYFQKYASE